MTTSPPDVDWFDIDHDAWPDDDLDPDPRLHDLRGQGLTAVELHTIQDVNVRPEYL